MIAPQPQTRRGMVRRALTAASAAALLAVVPVAAADPPPPVLSLNLPPLLSLTLLAQTPPPPSVVDLSIPARDSDLPPGLRLLVPEIIDLTVPVNLGASGLPLGGLRLSLPNIDLPNFSIFAGSLLGISGLGDLVSTLAPSLALEPDAAVGVGTKSVDLTCQVQATLNLPEGENVTIRGDVLLGGCTSDTGVTFESASGTLEATGSFDDSPTGFHGSQAGTLSLTWDNDQTSTVSVSETTQGGSDIKDAPIEGAAPIMARVTGGPLQGDALKIDEVSADFSHGLGFRGVATFTHGG